MKTRLVLALPVLAASLWAQPAPSSGVNHPNAPGNNLSYSDLYCSGFFGRRDLPRTRFVQSSAEAPHDDRYMSRATLFLRGPDFVVGQRYSLIRQVADANREDSSPEQSQRLGHLGALYADIGWVTVHSIENNIAVATFDFACDAAMPGDLVVPFEARSPVPTRSSEPPTFSFIPANRAPYGQLVGSKDFDTLLGNGQIVYTDFGADQGVKSGDYLFIERGYAAKDLNKVDAASIDLPHGVDDSAVNPAKLNGQQFGDLPKRLVGELLVLRTQPNSSVGLITRSFAEIQLGDVVQLEASDALHVATSATVASAETTACQNAPRKHWWQHERCH